MARSNFFGNERVFAFVKMKYLIKINYINKSFIIFKTISLKKTNLLHRKMSQLIFCARYKCDEMIPQLLKYRKTFKGSTVIWKFCPFLQTDEKMITVSLSNSSIKTAKFKNLKFFKVRNFAFFGKKFESYRETLKLETVHVNSNWPIPKIKQLDIPYKGHYKLLFIISQHVYSHP